MDLKGFAGDCWISKHQFLRYWIVADGADNV